ncbi:MAG TPA: DUF1329 domain-containing protein, partial [Colwellia sp.]|nr:DUF1329 domain-containing protein [Colwellia sp.]
MKTHINNKSLLLAISVALVSSGVSAKISMDEADKLGKELTPLGAIQAANKDGSIPAWIGGITKAPAGYTVGDHHIDPYPNDKVQYSITAKNVSD